MNEMLFNWAASVVLIVAYVFCTLLVIAAMGAFLGAIASLFLPDDDR